PYNRLTFTVLGNIARTYAAMGDVANAAAFQARVDRVLETETALNLAIGSERQKLLLLNGDSERTDRTISLDLNLAHGDPQTSSLAALILLQRKGRALDAMSDTLAALRLRFNADDRALLDQRNQTTAQLARLILRGPPNANPAEYEKQIKTLEDSKEQLESTISEHSAEFRAQAQPLTLQ